MIDEKRIVHKSFGALRISRASNSSDRQLFGSSVACKNTITLEIAPAEYTRGLHRDWIYGKSIPYIQVEMSQAQFAEAITNLNVGTGTPVTVTRLNGELVEGFKEESKFEQFQNEFASDTRNILKSITDAQKKVEELLTKKSVTKGDKEQIKHSLGFIESMLRANLPFLYESFNEQIGKTLHEAKMEIEAFADQRAVENMVTLRLENSKNEISENEILKNEN